MRRRALVLLLAALLLVATGCGGGDDGGDAAGDEPATTATTPEAEPGTTEDDDGDDGGDDDGGEGDAEAGADVFESAGCGSCHTLEAAGSTGSVGPSLDEESPDFDEVVEAVTEGRGAMPSFRDQLSEQQIRDVAAFVSESTSG